MPWNKLTTAARQVDGTYCMHSRKYCRELNLAVGPKAIIATVLVDLNLAVW